MSNFKALTVQGGTPTLQANGDILLVGTGTDTNGAVVMTIGAVNATEVNIGAASIHTVVLGNLTVNGTETVVGLTTFQAGESLTGALTQSGGVVQLDANAASRFTTSAGAITVDGFAGLTFNVNGTSVLLANSAGTAITVQAGVTFATTGTGNVNLPNNGSARFKIEGASVSANVTAANLGTLTAGATSDASSLHTHINLAGTVSGLTTTAMTTSGSFGYVSSNNTISKTDNAAMSSARAFGAYEGTSGTMQVSGVVSDAQFTTAGGSPSAGAAVYLAAAADDAAAGAGKLTATAPSASGSVVQEVGVCLDNSSYAGSKTSKVLLQVKTAIQL